MFQFKVKGPIRLKSKLKAVRQKFSLILRRFCHFVLFSFSKATCIRESNLLYLVY